MGLRLRDVAEIFDITLFTLINWESEKTFPDFHVLPKIDQFLGYCVATPAADRYEATLRIRTHILGISQEACAQSLGVDPSTLGLYENESSIGLSLSMEQRIYDGVRELANSHPKGV